MIIAYDMDGVLAAPVPDSFFVKKWRHMNGVERLQRHKNLVEWYKIAGLLLTPGVKEFHVITARKGVEDVRTVTREWFKINYPHNTVHLHMLSGSRTIENVVKFKGDVLKTIGASDYTEDNWDIVRGLRKYVTGTRIWLYKDGQVSL